MTHSPSAVARALAAALLALAACADRSPILDTAAPLTGSGIDFIDLGAGPYTVVVADFDGDGRPDLAATAVRTDGVIVILGRPGGFAPPRVYPVGRATQVLAGDFDGDGKLDLVVTYQDGMGVLLGKGDGTLGAVRSSGAGGSEASLVAGDFNRDGKLDVAMTKPESIRVLLGNGDGSFQPPKTQAVPAPPRRGDLALDLVVGDIDGDGTLDVLAPTRAGHLTSLFGNGDGTFRAGKTTEGWEYGRRQAFVGGDFDGDGKLDLAEASESSDSGHPVYAGILLGNGDGTFRGTGNTGLLGHGRFYGSSPKLTTFDLDGDGKLDLVVNIAQGSLMVTALGKGDGTLGAPSYYRLPGHVLVVADVDGDGKADVLTASGHGLAVSAGNGDGTLRAPRSFLLGTDEGGVTGRVAVGDFDRDGLADVALTYNNSTTQSIQVLLADGCGGLRRASGITLFESDELGNRRRRHRR
jgi:FG-GAP-like repeat/FG-GAP repeat